MTEQKPHLTDAQIEEVRAELVRALAKLQRSLDIGEVASRPVELDPGAVGRLSRIDSLQNQMLSQDLRERDRARLAAILGALRRIEDGSYGTCGGCGGAIEFERLLVFPETPRCVACAAGA